MKEIETLCKTCMGCIREAEKDFKEVYRCNNYAKAINNTR